MKCFLEYQWNKMKLDDAKVGDCCFFLIKGVNSPKFGEIYKISEEDNIIHVLEVKDSKYYSVHSKNFAWNKEDLKDKKWEDPHNYNDTVENTNEKETTKRSGNVHNRKKTTDSDKGRVTKSKSSPKSNGRKQKSVRGTGKQKSKTQRNRKTSRSKKD